MIRFYCSEWLWRPTDTRLGGTEEAVVEWSARMATEQEVEVYYDMEDLTHRGVHFKNRDSFQISDEPTIYVNNAPDKVGGNSWYLTTETNIVGADATRFKGIILSSEYARETLRLEGDVFIVPYGYDSTTIRPQRKVPNSCLYASSPDRGLDFLIEAWPEVVKQVPDAQLAVTYGGSIPGPNITAMGDVSEKTMNYLYGVSDFWLHPANGGEMFCIAGVKAQVSEAIPVYFPVMALKETVRHGIPTDKENFVQDLVGLMNDPKRKEAIREQLRKEPYPDWDDTTKELLALIA